MENMRRGGNDVGDCSASISVNEKMMTFAFGVVFVAALMIIAMFFPSPTPFQYTVFRIVLALAAAGIAALIPGLISIQMPWVRAGGAIAVFVLVYNFSPAALVTSG
jgi:MFS family permease